MPIIKISHVDQRQISNELIQSLSTLLPHALHRDTTANKTIRTLYGTVHSNDQLLAACEVQLSDNAASLRSLQVAKNNQNKGLGTLLLLNTLKLLEQKGISKLSIASTTAASDFFKRFGFCDVSAATTMTLHKRGDQSNSSLNSDDRVMMEHPCLSYFLSRLPATSFSQGLPGKHLMRLGADSESYHFNNEEHFLALHQSMMAQARKRIWILCDAISHPLLNNQHTSNAFLRLAKRNPQAEIKLLIANDKLGSGYFNPSVNMAQRLSSYVEIRTLNNTGMRIREMITLVDYSACIFRKNVKDASGFASFHNRLLAERMRSNFDHHWQFAKHSQELRRLAI